MFPKGLSGRDLYGVQQVIDTYIYRVTGRQEVQKVHVYVMT